MSYTALYRKWRPKTLDEVKGQDAICRTLKNQVVSQRVGHAYLFCGTRGTGKTSVAKIMAKAVNCERPVNGNPCNECETCKAIASESSMNVVEIDAASNNGVDNIRDIKEQVQYPPTQGKYRVFIIDEVHMLSNGAFNALLKTLEEPPEYVIFILATTEVHKIPVTVLSRCQRYDFKRISVETITHRLEELSLAEGITIEKKALAYIAKMADGAMRDALSLLDECRAFYPEGEIRYDQVLDALGATDIGIYSRLFGFVVNDQITQSLQVIEELVIQGRELGQFVIDFLWYLRNLLVVKTAEDLEGIVDVSRENMQLMIEDAKGVSENELVRYIRIFGELSGRIRYSPQKRVLLEVAIIKLSTPQMEEDVGSVLSRIEKLERSIKEGGQVVSFVSEQKKEQEQEKPKVITLPQAQYQDFIQLRNDWPHLVARMGAPGAKLLENVSIQTHGDGIIELIFSDETLYKLGATEQRISEIGEIVEQEYQKHFTFEARCCKEQEETEYKSIVDGMNAIHTKIEIEDI